MDCNEERKLKGLAYPRTCAKCGLGPCRHAFSLPLTETLHIALGHLVDPPKPSSSAEAPSPSPLGSSAQTKDERIQDLLEANNRLLERARKAEQRYRLEPGEATYYVEGKDADYFEKLSPIALTKALNKVAMDLVDCDIEPFEQYIPIVAIVSIAARRLDEAISAQEKGVSFNGLTPAQAERLAVLAEEAAEVVVAVGKVLRHGYESYDPRKDSQESNRAALMREIGDLSSIVIDMTKRGDVEIKSIERARDRKTLSRPEFMHHQEG